MNHPGLWFGFMNVEIKLIYAKLNLAPLSQWYSGPKLHRGRFSVSLCVCSNKVLPPPCGLVGSAPPCLLAVPALLLLSHLILNFFDFSGGQTAPQRHVRRVKKLIWKFLPAQRRRGSKGSKQIKLQIHLPNAISAGKFNSIRTNESLSRRLG